MRVLVTRPAAQAQAWAERLRAHGVQAEVLPLIEIAPPDDAEPVAQAWHSLTQRRMVFFVSPNAVEHFFGLRPTGFGAWPPGVLAASPGPGTTQALVAAGVPPSAVAEPAANAPQFDSESLWQRLRERPWSGARVLIVRGESGRDWLAERLREAGAEVEFVSAYRRAPPLNTPHLRGLLDAALDEPQHYLWFFSSSEAIDNLRHLHLGADWSESRALATHPRIAQTARHAGFGEVLEARPAFDAVMACIQSRAS
jgi:uroporphyrinogen-III synthase